MKVYNIKTIEDKKFRRKNLAVDLRKVASQVLTTGKMVLLTDLITSMGEEKSPAVYASVRSCFTPRNGYCVVKKNKRLYVMRKEVGSA